MSCDSATDRRLRTAPFARRRSRGLTLIELLTALTIAMVFVGGTAMALIQMMRTNERAQARLEALGNGRHALDQISADLKLARRGPPGPPTLGQTLFHCENSTTTVTFTGNNRDDDSDSRVDEELFNGIDDDGDWSGTNDDRHARITSGVYERKSLKGIADPGDAHVNEDLRYTAASLRFRRFPAPSTPTTGVLQLKYTVESVFDGSPSVLVRELQALPTSPGDPVTTSTGPVAFNVVSFGVLLWDAQQRKWVDSWNAAGQPPGFELPVSALVSVTVYAGKKPLEQVDPSEPLETVTLSTMVNIEQMLASPQYASVRPTYP
jgi:type II secretory pathway pseudopilin PulG